MKYYYLGKFLPKSIIKMHRIATLNMPYYFRIIRSDFCKSAWEIIWLRVIRLHYNYLRPLCTIWAFIRILEVLEEFKKNLIYILFPNVMKYL